MLFPQRTSSLRAIDLGMMLWGRRMGFGFGLASSVFSVLSVVEAVAVLILRSSEDIKRFKL